MARRGGFVVASVDGGSGAGECGDEGGRGLHLPHQNR